MSEKEIKLIKDLLKHYKSNIVVDKKLIKSYLDQYGTIRGILINLLYKFEPNKNISDEYIDKKLSDYGIQLREDQDSPKQSSATSKDETPGKTVQVETENKQGETDKTKGTQKETAASDSNKKSKTGLIVTLLIVGAIGIIGFLNQDMLLGYFSNTTATDIANDKLDDYQVESDIIRENVNAIDNSENKNDEIINDIRDDFYYLKNNWVNLKRISLSDNITIYSTLEYPSLNNHFCAQILNEGINYEFYVNNEKLYFVYSHFEGIENRYYFNPNGEIIMWLDSEKAEVKDGLLAEKNSLNLIFEEIYFNTETNDIKKSNLLGVINDPDGYTNVRADKSSSSSVIYEIYDENKRFEIIDDSGEWWKIKFDIDEYPYEIIGFIHNSRVELIDNDEDFLVAKNGFINADNLNFRSTPEINNQNIISYLQYGDNVNILSSVNKTLTDVKHCIIEYDIVVNIDGVKTVILAGKMLDILSMKDSYIICGYKQKNGKYNKFSVNYEDADIVRQEKWYKIEVDNRIGFIYQKFVTLQ